MDRLQETPIACCCCCCCSRFIKHFLRCRCHCLRLVRRCLGRCTRVRRELPKRGWDRAWPWSEIPAAAGVRVRAPPMGGRRGPCTAGHREHRGCDPSPCTLLSMGCSHSVIDAFSIALMHTHASFHEHFSCALRVASTACRSASYRAGGRWGLGNACLLAISDPLGIQCGHEGLMIACAASYRVRVVLRGL